MEAPESAPIVTESAQLDKAYPTMTEILTSEGGLEQGPQPGRPAKALVKTDTVKATPEKAESAAPERYKDPRSPVGAPVDQIALEQFSLLAKAQNLKPARESTEAFLHFGGEKLRAITEAPYKAWMIDRKLGRPKSKKIRLSGEGISNKMLSRLSPSLLSKLRKRRTR